MEAIERDYAPKGVKFYYIYKALAHPENNGYVTPFNLKERLMHVAEAKRTLGSRFTWICDTMDNDLKHALGDRPNSEFVIDPKGEIVVSRSWSSPNELRQDLAKLVGEVSPATDVRDLNMKQLPPRQQARTGVVKRVDLPGQMSPLKITALESRTPFYAKLRAESGNDNKLYLGFFLDPLYNVHWNNKSPAITFSIEAPSGVRVTPDKGTGPKVEVDADADPREFLVDLNGRSSDPLKVTVKYFACDDAETFCVPVTQEYLVSFDRDRDGGSRRSPGGSRGQGGRPAGGQMADMMRRIPVLAALDNDSDGTISSTELTNAPESLRRLDLNGDGDITSEEMRPTSAGPSRGQGSGRPGQDRGQDRAGMMRRMFQQSDGNDDGELSGDEIPEPMRRMIDRIDTNRDGAISESEMETMISRRATPAGRPPGRRGGN